MVEKLIEVKKIGAIASLAASATQIIGNFHTGKCRTLSVSAKGTYHASATSGITIKFYIDHPDIGVDTEPFTSFVPTLSAGNKVQRSALIDVPEGANVLVKITNDDGTYAVTELAVGIILSKWEYPEGN